MKSILLVLLLLSSIHAHALDSKESMIGIDLKAIDHKVDPCSDFYQYACGNWIKKTALPADKDRLYRSFTEIDDRNLDILHTTLEQYSKTKNTDPEKKKLGDFYASCMDEGSVEKESPKAIKEELAVIDAMKSKEELPALLAKLHLKGINAFFSFGQETDLVDPTVKIAVVAQGGFGLPDSTYYTSDDPAKVKLRDAYREHLGQMFEFLGKNKVEAKKLATTSFAIEDALAKKALTPEESSDPTLNYHPLAIGDLNKAAPLFSWNAYLKGLSINPPKKIDLNEPKFIAAVQEVLATQDLESIQNYLRVRMIDSDAPFLGKKIYQSWFQFYGTTLNGQKKPKPRWKRCVEGISESSGMGEALGKAFVEKTFSAQAKEKASQMISHIRQALKEDLAHLDWLDEATRTKAQEKLEKITLKIGYPEHWKDYSALVISKNAFLENVLHAREFRQKEDLNKIGGPVDPLLWDMTPQMVNAYYAPDLNQINFPAGILQAPFFSEKYSDAVNYGAIGVVIGHEITHGFDTVGSKFDGRGMMSDWWTAKVKSQFADKASCMKKQYSSYQPLPGLNVNGDLTITENIADNGGLKISYAAFHSSHPKATAKDDQDLFLSMAQSWCMKASDQAVRRGVSSDSHSPARFRINGSFQNSPDFAKAFSCSEKSAMAPQNRCFIW